MGPKPEPSLFTGDKERTVSFRLPELSERAGKWITALEENKGGIRLTLGDIITLLIHVSGKHPTEGIFFKAIAAQLLPHCCMVHAAMDHRVDNVNFGGFKNLTWAVLCQQFPEKIDPKRRTEMAEGRRVCAEVPTHVPAQMEGRGKKEAHGMLI